MGVVLCYDGWALLTGRETMSAFCARMVDGPQPGEDPRVVAAVKYPTIGLWLGLSWHLLNGGRHLLPSRFHGRYRQMHPLWRLHDLAVERSARSLGIPISDLV